MGVRKREIMSDEVSAPIYPPPEKRRRRKRKARKTRK